MQEIVQAYGALKKKFDGGLDYSDTDSETDFDDLMEAFVFRYFNRYRFGCGNCGHNFRSRDSSYMSGEGSSQKKRVETKSEPVEPKSKSQKRRQKKQRQK